MGLTEGRIVTAGGVLWGVAPPKNGVEEHEIDIFYPFGLVQSWRVTHITGNAVDVEIRQSALLERDFERYAPVDGARLLLYRTNQNREAVDAHVFTHGTGTTEIVHEKGEEMSVRVIKWKCFYEKLELMEPVPLMGRFSDSGVITTAGTMPSRGVPMPEE